MSWRFGLDGRDRRNMMLATGVMILLLFVYADGSLGERVLAAVVGGLFAALIFAAVTVLINAYKPDHW
ncbi:hypothetical protein [Natronococcus sp. A-GB7]|uniref:hypothetical protein n=1 Tax=Natronococcus sp. A-GB7 TaxID=3037649 RepID=UPI00241D3E8C|nr:hypothetical protein [Natronococcus sp. A-GB7]MDG5818848.1 hypothetical protein [Natronococcus sp. A-GB7]